MAGRINDEDIAAVRERARIEDVVGSYVTLRSAGGGLMKGLCPFHDESTPSFNVTPARGRWHCFGACDEGGDAIAFMQKIENLSFTEAVQKLADRVGIQLRISDDGGPRLPAGLRVRLMEAHKAAAEFYAEQLGTPDALTARQFLAGRGFDRTAAEEFGVGFAPRGGRRLAQHLKGRGFDEDELITGGLLRRGGYDFFSGRLLWPIRDVGKSVVGFGARRIFDDDRLPAKYINTPETPLYKKSRVLYGLDLARTEIGRSGQAVIVEGYTDVMAAHLSGVRTAVASCGTAFGNDHARMLQRLLGDQGKGEVVFTFDGDAAGQAAALKVFGLDSTFITQTYVAIEPTGLDPCDLRLQHGEAAVRELVGRRIPLYRFVMTNILTKHDLDRADARIDALREAAPLVASVRDASKVSGYIRELAGWLGMDPDEVRREISSVAARSSKRQETAAPASPASPRRATADVLPDPHDRSLLTERETAKLIIQCPELVAGELGELAAEDFTHPAYGAVLRHAQKALANQPAGPGEQDRFREWPRLVTEVEDNPWVNSLVTALAVEPLHIEKPTAAYATAYLAKLRLLTVSRQINQIKSRLQRTNPVENQNSYNKTFSELVVLEAERKRLLNRSLGLE